MVAVFRKLLTACFQFLTISVISATVVFRCSASNSGLIPVVKTVICLDEMRNAQNEKLMECFEQLGEFVRRSCARITRKMMRLWMDEGINE